MLETATRKPRNGQPRHCNVCKVVVFWFVPDPERGLPFVEMITAPAFGKMTDDGYLCKTHWEERAQDV